MPRKILTIIPAGGWTAAYGDDHLAERFQLVCWALVEENGVQRVVGMDVAGSDDIKVEFCEDSPDFLGYREPDFVDLQAFKGDLEE